MQLHKLTGYIQDIYLIEEQHGLMLLDGASRPDVDTICDFIVQQLQRPLSHLKNVIVTHMHPDHAGGAHALRKVTGCRIITADVAGQWYQGIDGKLMMLTDMLLAQWVAGRMKKRRKRIWYSPTLKPDIKLKDGDTVPDFEDWVVLFTQGHTDRDLSVWHKATKKIYVADLMVRVKGRYIPPYPVFHPNRYKASINKIRAIQPDKLLLAHGGEVSLSDEDYDFLSAKAPDTPATHWRSTKAKLGRVFGLGSR